MMPMAKVQVPKPPELEPWTLGLIPLKNGQQVLYVNGKKHFIVPKTGGVFFPKKSAENVELNNDSWAYYAKGVDDSVKFYNSQQVERNNDQLAAFKLGAKNKSWWKFW